MVELATETSMLPFDMATSLSVGTLPSYSLVSKPAITKGFTASPNGTVLLLFCFCCLG